MARSERSESANQGTLVRFQRSDLSTIRVHPCSSGSSIDFEPKLNSPCILLNFMIFYEWYKTIVTAKLIYIFSIFCMSLHPRIDWRSCNLAHQAVPFFSVVSWLGPIKGRTFFTISVVQRRGPEAIHSQKPAPNCTTRWAHSPWQSVVKA